MKKLVKLSQNLGQFLFFKIWKISINCGIIISNDIEEIIIKNTNIEKYY